jgi:uroporphyrinogen III methyltransferase / synthase
VLTGFFQRFMENKMSPQKKGKVYLVGAGPGDPGLLTLRAKDLMENADVIVYDYLANETFLEYARNNAEIIYAGKSGGSHTMKQEDINRLLCEKALKGLNVVRLKGGDPFIFGRGGEEAQDLARAGIAFEIVPGVTSAIAVPSYAGIPLTHRDYTATVAFITGNEDPAKDRSNIDWKKISTGAGTLVFLMGIGNLEAITGELIKNGRSPDTPVAIIHKGTVPEQRTLEGTLGSISSVAKEKGVKPPGIIVVGDVVRLRNELNWFEKRPLFGRRILVTRAREQASQFMAGLMELGAECIEFPTIEIRHPHSWDMLDRSIQNIEDYHWLIFTSVNGVEYFFRRIFDLGKDIRCLGRIKVAAIGPKTATAVQTMGINPDLVPDEYKAEGVIEAFMGKDLKGTRILIPRAAEAREILPDELTKMGAHCDVVEAYRTVMPDAETDKLGAMLSHGDIDMATFTSSSTVTNLLSMFKGREEDLKQWMKKVAVACIGPVTAKTAEKKGFRVSITPKEYTIEALTASIVEYFSAVDSNQK